MGVPGSANFLLAGAQGYQIERSLRFNNADSAYLSKGSTLSGNRRLHTLSFWVKRAGLGSRQTLFGNTNSSGFNGLYFEFDGNDALLIGDYTTGWVWQLNTIARYRDPSAWYHIVFAVDTANATASNRARLYVNNIEVTAFSTASYMSQNYDTYWNYNASAIGRLGDYNGQYFSGYLTEIHFIDGQALTPSSFGETDTITGVWKPKKYAGTYGTNGFYLKFADNSGTTSTTLGKDSSGNGNNWTPNNFSVTAGAGNDSMIDTPTPYADGGNGRGNYCTWNPLSTIAFSLANGNLDVTGSVTSDRVAKSTFAVSSGKWYWEITNTVLTASSATLGICSDSAAFSLGVMATGSSVVYYGTNGNKYVNGSGSAYGASFTTNDVIGIALDLSANTVTFYKNNTSQGSISITSGITWVACWVGQGNTADAATANFGQRPFAYTPPSGFLALNTQNLPEPSIKKPSSYMDVLTYTGDSNATKTITGLGFNPDLVWIKNRNLTNPNAWFDSVRGVNKFLSSNYTTAEENPGLYGYVSAFNSDGFTLTTNGPSGFGYVNGATNTYVAWCWDESATPGFDIVTYTGTGSATTVAHSLGVAPSMIILKGRSIADNWRVGHYRLNSGINPWRNALSLNSTIAEYTATTNPNVFNDTAPTSSVFTIGTDASVNSNGSTYVAYLWSEVAGFSKFGSYTGNGSTDGPFVFCGFRPRWILFKGANVANTDWMIYDTARSTTNVTNLRLDANSSGSEAVSTGHNFDILSNGFKLRETSNNFNNANSTYIFAAFAESPFKYSLAR